MFRATSYILTVRTLLYRRHPSDFQIATISRFPTNFKKHKPPPPGAPCTNPVKCQGPKERESCPLPPPPPPPPPKDDRLFWGAMTLVLLAGGLVVYAKGSPEVRDWLTINAPWFDEFIAIVYQENMTYSEFAVACVEDTKKFIATLTGQNKPKKCSLDGGPVADVPEEPEVEEVTDEDALVCEPEPPPVVTRDICDIERCIKDLGDSVLNNYNTARDACACYNALVEDTMQTFTFGGMKALRAAMLERQDLVQQSLTNACNCMNKLDEMIPYLDCGVQATKEEIRNSKYLHRDYHDRFRNAFIEYQWENDKSTVMDRQWQSVEETVDKYTYENEAMFPELKYSHPKPTINGDIDIILYNSYRYIHQLNGQLKSVSDAMTERITRAMDNLPKCEKADAAREAQLQNALKQKRAEVEALFKKREDDQKARNDKELKDSSQRQLDRHEETLASKLEIKEAEVLAKFDKMVEDKVAAEKRVLKSELEEMALKLKQVEEKLTARLKAERENRRSQELWTAGAALLEATKGGDPYVPVDKQLKAIEKASGGDDKLVTTVLMSIPQHVREKGIVPESVLKEGFRVMEKTARNVALIESDGAAMPIYILSWLQGLLLFMKMSGIPQEEFDKPPLEPDDELDTFDLLQRARFWMEQGDLAATLRYVALLKGASKAASAKWYDQARAHLEVRQAANAVLAHAAAMGLQYI